MSRTRWLDIAAIVMTVAVLAGLSFVSRPQHTPTITVAPSTAQVAGRSLRRMRPGPLGDNQRFR